jgi:hypothetical protein
MEEQHGFNSSNGDPEEWTPTAGSFDEDDMWDEDDNHAVDDHSNGVSV